jgi:hypothetical protein
MFIGTPLVRSNTEVTFNLVKLGILFIVMSLFINCFPDFYRSYSEFLLLAGTSNTIFLLWELRNQQVCYRSLAEAKLLSKELIGKEVLYPTLQELKILCCPIKKSILVRVLFLVFSLWWLVLIIRLKYEDSLGSIISFPVLVNFTNFLICLIAIPKKSS